MDSEPSSFSNLSEFLKYLAAQPDDGRRIPTLADLSHDLGISTATLREQLEVARMMGIVEVRPKTGIRKLNYRFRPAVATSVAYAISQDSANFSLFSDLRKHLEAAYFIEAAQSLTSLEIAALQKVVEKAGEKIKGSTFQLPNSEHREFHLMVYQHIGNPFVMGILESYWDLYRASGLEMYPDIDYLQRIWQYHARIADLIKSRDYVQGLNVLLEHMELIKQREKPSPRQSFE